jgi:hypothetical protein
VARHVPIDRLGLRHVVSRSQTVSCQGCANKHRGHSSDIVPSPSLVTPLNPNAPDFKIGDRIIVISGKHTHKTKRRTITKVTPRRQQLLTYFFLLIFASPMLSIFFVSFVPVPMWVYLLRGVVYFS